LDAGVDAEVSAQLLLFAEQTTDFVGVADPWGRVLYLNPAARKRLGIADPTETGLLTQSAFDDRVGRALANVHRGGEPCALVLVDVVGVTDATDTCGQLTAPTVMRSLAGRLTRLARTTDVAGRVGEHRLGLLLGAVRGHGEALRVAQMVYEALVDPPVTTAAGEVAASVRCGAAVSTSGDVSTDLIERASKAMSNEPAIRDVDVDVGGTVIMTDRSDGSPNLADFRVGLSHGDVWPYAQPVVDLRSGLLVGYRGMARWQHRRLGVLEASAFIDMIADTPLASQVDLNVARELAAVLALSVGATPLRLYTPVSRRLIADVRTEQYLSEIADAFFLSISQVRLQVAQPLLDRWSPALHDALESLRDAGVAFVLTGVEHGSDARALAEHPFDELHISPRLTNAAVTDPDARCAVSVIVRLARERDVLVAAAGVDTEPQADVLIETGCDFAFGDLYGRAEPANTID
jgi:c-di-GMP-specific phosphodiesterase